jgi:hypothetical protein
MTCTAAWFKFFLLEITTFVIKNKTHLKKIWILRKLIVILNLLIIDMFLQFYPLREIISYSFRPTMSDSVDYFMYINA